MFIYRILEYITLHPRLIAPTAPKAYFRLILGLRIFLYVYCVIAIVKLLFILNKLCLFVCISKYKEHLKFCTYFMYNLCKFIYINIQCIFFQSVQNKQTNFIENK